jgi:hypothetical protein
LNEFQAAEAESSKPPQTRPGKAEPGVQSWRRLVRLAGGRPDMAVSVAGAHGLDAMIALCRDGFERVRCVRQVTCAGADETSDVLLIDGRDRQALAGQIANTVRLLRDGGVLGLRLASTRDQRVAIAALAAAGFNVAGCAHGQGGLLAAFTIQRAPPLRMAS